MSKVFSISKNGKPILTYQIPNNLLQYSRLLNIYDEISLENQEETNIIDIPLFITKNEFQETHEYLIQLHLLKTTITQFNQTDDYSLETTQSIKFYLEKLNKPEKSNLFFSWLDIDDDYEFFLLKIINEEIFHIPNNKIEAYLTNTKLVDKLDIYYHAIFTNNLNLLKYSIHHLKENPWIAIFDYSLFYNDISVYLYINLKNDCTAYLKDNTTIDNAIALYENRDNINDKSLEYKSIVDAIFGNLFEIAEWIIEKENIDINEDPLLISKIREKIYYSLKTNPFKLTQTIQWITNKCLTVLDIGFDTKKSTQNKYGWLNQAIFENNIYIVKWLLTFNPEKQLIYPFLEQELRRGWNILQQKINRKINMNLFEIVYDYCSPSIEQSCQLFYQTYRYGYIQLAKWFIENNKLTKEQIDKKQFITDEKDINYYYHWETHKSKENAQIELAQKIKDFTNWFDSL
jgi:hypothetical protein